MNIFLGIKRLFSMPKERKKRIAEGEEHERTDIPTEKKLHPDVQKFRIIKKIEYSPETVGFIMESETGEAAYFRAGQSVRVFYENYSRPYSLCSAPKDALKGKYEIAVKNTGGKMTDYLFSLSCGDKLTLSSPIGNFYYSRLRDGENILGIAGGMGITPFLSMIRAILIGDENFSLTLIYAAKSGRDFIEKDFLIFAQKDKRIKVIFVSEEGGEGYIKGFVTAGLIEENLRGKTVYVCGSEGMHKYIDGELVKLNKKLNVRSDPYLKPPQLLKHEKFKLNIIKNGENILLKCYGDEPIIMAAERAGIKTESACRSGECGFCKGRLISGEVKISDSDGRRAAEKKYNYIYLCSTYALSDITVEIDS